MAFFRKRSEKSKKIAHILAGVVILLHGYEKMEKSESSYWFFYLSGIVFILMALFHKQLVQKIKWADGLFYIIEAMVLFIIAYDYWHHGKKALPFAYLIAAIGYVIVSIIVSGKSMKVTDSH